MGCSHGLYEIFFSVVDRLHRSQLPREHLVLPPGGSDNSGATPGGQLGRIGADAAGGSYDQDCLALIEVHRVYEIHGGEPRHRQRRRFCETNSLRLPGDDGRRGTDIFRVGAFTYHQLGEVPVHLVSFGEPLHIGTESLDHTCGVETRYQGEAMFLLILENPVCDLPVERIDSGGPDVDQYLACPDIRNWECYQGYRPSKLIFGY